MSTAINLQAFDATIEKIQEQRLAALRERDAQQQSARAHLRDQVLHLREPYVGVGPGPASLSIPGFTLTPSSGYKGALEPGERSVGASHLTPMAEKKFFEHLKSASEQNLPSRREADVGKAAKVAARDWDQRHGHGETSPGVVRAARQQAQAQAIFAAREIGARLGLSQTSSTVLGYSLERAMEREGFKVMANHVIDKGAAFFKASASSVAQATGIHHTLEQNLARSTNWLAEHGVTKAAVKDFVGRHAGKFQVLSEVAAHPEALTRAAYLISKAPGVMDGVMAAASDKELRKALGTITMAAGETAAVVPGARGMGSVAVVAGSLMRGDSPEESGRHIFRAALSVLGGAAGGVAGGAVSAGFGSVAGVVVGSELGSRLADKLLEVYDKAMGHDPAQAGKEKLVNRSELRESAQVLEQRGGSALKGAAERATQDLAAQATELSGGAGGQSPLKELTRERDMGREMTRDFTRSMSAG